MKRKRHDVRFRDKVIGSVKRSQGTWSAYLDTRRQINGIWTRKLKVGEFLNPIDASVAVGVAYGHHNGV